MRCKCCGAPVRATVGNRHTLRIPQHDPYIRAIEYDAFTCEACGWDNLGRATKVVYVEGFAGEVTRMKCKVCGVEFEPKKENKYMVKIVKRTSLMTADTEYYDAFDCPQCGCQQLAGLRHMEVDGPTYTTIKFDLKEKADE